MKRQILKRIPLVLIIYIFVTLVTACTTKPGSNTQTRQETTIPQIKLVAPVYTEIKGNKVIYRGIALSAEYFGEEKPGIVIKPYVEGLLQNGEPFSVSADIGYYNAREHTITLNNNINAVLNNTYTLKSDKVQYFLNKKLIISEEPITVYGKDLQLYGDRGSIDLGKDLMLVKGNIRAKIYRVRLR
ncbi:MAG: LPS export ABC transporter periplasmic protein LptC [bacterium]